MDQELGVYWINTWSKGTLVKQKDEPIVARGSLNVDSYFGHSFLVVDEEKVRDTEASHNPDPTKTVLADVFSYVPHACAAGIV